MTQNDDDRNAENLDRVLERAKDGFGDYLASVSNYKKVT
jgi:hypothetical protein